MDFSWVQGSGLVLAVVVAWFWSSGFKGFVFWLLVFGLGYGGITQTDTGDAFIEGIKRELAVEQVAQAAVVEENAPAIQPEEYKIEAPDFGSGEFQ